MLGDIGSAFQIGKHGLQSYLFCSRKLTKQFENAILELFGTLCPNEIIAKVYKLSSPAASIAKLAKVVALDASNGEKYAQEIIESNMEQLAVLAFQHAQKYILPSLNDDQVNWSHSNEASTRSPLKIFLAGGLWKAGRIFKVTFLHKAEKCFGVNSINCQVISQPPVRGALHLAQKLQYGY